MAVLYQKYRPQRLAEVVGQEGIVRTLTNAAASGQLGHAYLFTGSRGIGKTSIARIVAKAVNCLDLQNGDPCGSCGPCQAIAADNFLDVIEIDAASHTGVDNIRELIEHVQFKPTHGRMKVFIIDEVHMLSKAAFNALLKTLEEPPVHAMFILATTDIEKVPDTIISRTQRFDFRKITATDMLNALKRIADIEQLTLPDGTLQLIVSNAEGGMRDALSLLDTIAALGATATAEEVRGMLGLTTISSIEQLLDPVFSHNSGAIPEFFEAQTAQGVDFITLNKNVLEYLRMMLVFKTSKVIPANALLDKAQTEAIKHLAETIKLPQLLFTIRLFMRAYKEISQSPLPELPMLLAAIEASVHGTTATPVSQSIQQKTIALPIRPDVPPAVSSVSHDQITISDEIQIAEALPSITEIITLKPTLTTEPDFGVDITKEQVLMWWPEIVQRIKTVNSPLATLLKNSPLQDVSQGKITIAVKYLFHKEHLENTKHLALIKETIAGVCGKNLILKAVIVKDAEEPIIRHTVDALSDAIKIFGGELVE